MLHYFGEDEERWERRHYDQRTRLLRGLARMRAEQVASGPAQRAQTSPAGTMKRVQVTTEIDPTMPFGIPAGELG